MFLRIGYAFGVVFMLACFAAWGQSATPAPPEVAPAPTTPAPSGAISFHSFGITHLEYDDDAKKLVYGILGTFGITQVDWDILLTPDDQDTAFAMARYVPSTRHHQIIFNQPFMTKIGQTSGQWAPYCVASHEIGHLMSGHLEKKVIKVHDAELEADYYCGLILGRMGADYDQTVGSIAWFSGAPDYPTHDERIAQIGHGWRDATGQNAPEVVAAAESHPHPTAALVPTTAGLGIVPDARPVASDPTEILKKFEYRKNRDIVGHDIAKTGDRPGIPGVNLETCATRCDQNPQCKAFSFDTWNGWCFLKDRITTSLLDPPSVLGVKKPGRIPDASTKINATISVLLNKRFHDEPILTKKARNLQACKALCADELRCVAFTYLKKAKPEQACQMFNSSQGYYADDEADSGFKRQEVSSN